MYMYDECDDGFIANTRGKFEAYMCINNVSHESTTANS